MVEMVEREAEKKENKMATAGIIGRIFGLWLPIWVFGVVMLGITLSPKYVVWVFTAPLLLPIFGELLAYNHRKSKGWSYWKNVSEEWKKERLDQLMREQKESAVRVNAELKGSDGDKSDIRYWHGLFKDGIISESEYEAKKKELLK